MRPHRQSPYIQSALLNVLRTAEGATISAPSLVTRIWGHNAPSNPKVNIAIAVHLLRRRGFPIFNQRGYGYRFVPEDEKTPAVKPGLKSSTLGGVASRKETERLEAVKVRLTGDLGQAVMG